MHDNVTARKAVEQLRADIGIHAGVRVERDHCANLDPTCTGLARSGKHLWRAGASRYPVGQSGLGDLLEVWLVTGAEHEVTPVIE